MLVTLGTLRVKSVNVRSLLIFFPNWENQSEAWASQEYKAFIAFQGSSAFL